MSEYFLGATKRHINFEKEVHGDCLSCGEQIEHPLCPECIAKGYFQWIHKFSGTSHEIKENLEHYLFGLRRFNGKSIKCVSCLQMKTHVCPYCFTDFLYKITKEAGVGVKLLSEFLFIFNFDFKGRGYSRELDVFGGY